MKVTLLLLVLALQLLPPVVHAAFYQWVDPQGVTHFTDNPDKIPEAYRSRAKKLKLSEEPASSAAQPSSQASAPAPDQAAAHTFGGHPDSWWREQFLALRGQLKALQDGLVEKQAKLVELRRQRVIFTRAQDRVALNSLQAEIAVDEVRVAELQSQITDLERRADRAYVPVEWRQ
jgi:hypothetical protein